MKWKPGDRVTREVYMDDGTWQRQGDRCLERSPLRYGVVESVELDELGCALNRVAWDDGTIRTYFDHGVSAFRPRRIQRKRTRGWRMPPGAVYVGRPSKWGNPHRRGDHSDSDVIDAYEDWLDGEIAAGHLDLEELRGKLLACWCPLGAPCHADVLIRKANR